MSAGYQSAEKKTRPYEAGFLLPDVSAACPRFLDHRAFLFCRAFCSSRPGEKFSKAVCENKSN